MSQFSFSVALAVTQSVLASTKWLSVKLQGPYVDVACAHRDIDTVKATLQGTRCNVNTIDALHPSNRNGSRCWDQEVCTTPDEQSLAECPSTELQ